ncbi:alpha/beta hydrolase [Massilia glaciei]|uniref:Alpha/beta hydrolase n=1 Tax=Massilia glaciei TaxID=1524097 RepID=A0A2U2I617_9BURK|nr:alpha/beta hydrolase [Massilia glaciei]PWF55200.1 alpha/beta hydrolase [Massilia glaciei]
MYAFATLVLAAVVAIIVAGDRLSDPVLRTIGSAPPDMHAAPALISVAAGESVAGWFVRGVPGRGAVPLLHGVRSDRRQMAARARFLTKAGYAVMLIDLSAQGESSAGRITFGVRESVGVKAALEYLRGELPDEQLGVIGVSLGAAAFVMAHAAPALDAVVLESMYATIEDAVEDRLAIRLGTPGRMLSPLLLWQLPIRLGVSADQMRPLEHMGGLSSPLLIASGMLDRHTPFGETERLFEAANAPKELWLVRGAKHVDLRAFAPQDYEARILAFLIKHMAGSDGRAESRTGSVPRMQKGSPAEAVTP